MRYLSEFLSTILFKDKFGYIDNLRRVGNIRRASKEAIKIIRSFLLMFNLLMQLENNTIVLNGPLFILRLILQTHNQHVRCSYGHQQGQEEESDCLETKVI